MGCHGHCPGSLSISGIKHSDQSQHNREEGLFQHMLPGHSPTERKSWQEIKAGSQGCLLVHAVEPLTREVIVKEVKKNATSWLDYWLMLTLFLT